MNREQVFVEFRKFAEQDNHYFKFGRTGIIEDVLAYFGLPTRKFTGASSCVHEDHLEILHNFLRSHASDEQVALVYDISTNGKRVPIVDPCCNSADSVFVSMVMNENRYQDIAIIREGIESGIMSTGNAPYFLDKPAHNDYITKVMVKEIHDCKFLVADFTHQNCGVYYEAGYAAALGKTVIHLCRKDDFDNVHFDIKQIQFVIWENAQDLAEKLKEQIQKSGLAVK